MAGIILSQAFISLGIMAYYELNKAYISHQLCENRNNPKAGCNGHCYLVKQLKKAEQGESKQAQNVLKEKEEIISFNPTALLQKYFPVFQTSKAPLYQPLHYMADTEHYLIKPPTV